MASQDEQAMAFGSWEPVAVGVGVVREADPPAVFATTFPAWAQGSVGSVSPPRAEYADGLAVERC